MTQLRKLERRKEVLYDAQRKIRAGDRRLRGIGRGIVLKLAESGAKVAVHYFQKEDQAKATLEKLRACGSDGFVVQADVCKPEEIRRMFARVKSEFGWLDVFVNNARPEVPTFYDGQ